MLRRPSHLHVSFPLVLALTLSAMQAAVAAEAPAPEPADGQETSLPRWEWGAGIGGAWVRDYPGSRHSELYALPYPWFTWRSDRVELGREGGRGILYRTRSFAVDFTLAANPPSDAGDNPERAGMPELDAVLEPGFRARLRYLLDDRGDWRLDLRLPVRMAYGVSDGLHTYSIGLHSEPSVSLDHRLAPGWTWAVSAGLGFAEKGYADFYYGVAPVYATAIRPAYEADGGYAGWQVGSRISWKRDKLSTGMFIRIENVAGASFADSPLVSTPWGTTIGGNVSWRFGQSRHHVHTGESP